MNKYFQLLQKEVLKDIKIKESNFRFNLLSGTQRWMVVNDEIDEIIQTLHKKPDIPFIGLQKGEKLYILDLEDKYLNIVNDSRLTDIDRGLKQRKLPARDSKIYFTYPLFGRMDFSWGDSLFASEDDLIETYKNFKINFAIWVSAMEALRDGINIKYTIEPRKFTFAGHFLTHIIPAGYKGLTVSFIIPYVRVANLLFEKSRNFPQFRFMFFDQLTFADAFEVYVFKITLETIFGINYSPLLRVKDYKLRINNMMKFLNRI